MCAVGLSEVAMFLRKWTTFLSKKGHHDGTGEVGMLKGSCTRTEGVSACPYLYRETQIDKGSIVLLGFTSLYFRDTASFTNWRFVATPIKQVHLAPFFQQHLLAFCLSVTFWSQQCLVTVFLCHRSYNISNVFISRVYVMVSVISGLLCYHCNCFGAPWNKPK